MHLLVLRFSAIGDVALTVPVLKAFQQQYPEVKISVVSQGFLEPLFQPLNINFVKADLRGSHRGIPGLRKLYNQIVREHKPDAVIDLHGVLRSIVLTTFFRFRGTPFYRIDKGRKEKEALTRRQDKERLQLAHSCERYAAVFTEAGFPLQFKPDKPPLLSYHSEAAEKLWQELAIKSKIVGIAPLASFPGKSWSLSRVKELIGQLLSQGYQVILFGGAGDRETLDKLKGNSGGVINLADKLDFAGEITLMQKLAVMLAMDSGNMHLATLAGIPVVSIWGATHHFAGFGPLGDNQQYIAEIDPAELSCRPCSVFGKKPCFRHDYACLAWLETKAVMDKLKLALQAS